MDLKQFGSQLNCFSAGIRDFTTKGNRFISDGNPFSAKVSEFTLDLNRFSSHLNFFSAEVSDFTAGVNLFSSNPNKLSFGGNWLPSKPGTVFQHAPTTTPSPSKGSVPTSSPSRSAEQRSGRRGCPARLFEEAKPTSSAPAACREQRREVVRTADDR
ncbi:MAG: hypothetical protein JSS57_09950 [Proteobacteria bacterium]|nr:hypothetical protein [Pseudomonadota bacterium]